MLRGEWTGDEVCNQRRSHHLYGKRRRIPDKGEDGLTLIDAGYPGKEAAAFARIRALNRSPDEFKHLIFTHGDPDHIGSGAAMVRRTGARTYTHPLDITMAESGGPFRPLRTAPGMVRGILCKMLYNPAERVEPVAINQLLGNGEVLPIAGGMEVIHAPGHCAGQVALLWRPGKMLFPGNVCMNVLGIGDPVGFENLEEGRASQRRVAGLSFDAVAFGHGGAISCDAATHLRSKWLSGERWLSRQCAAFENLHRIEGVMSGQESDADAVIVSELVFQVVNERRYAGRTSLVRHISNREHNRFRPPFFADMHKAIGGQVRLDQPQRQH